MTNMNDVLNDEANIQHTDWKQEEYPEIAPIPHVLHIEQKHQQDIYNPEDQMERKEETEIVFYNESKEEMFNAEHSSSDNIQLTVMETTNGQQGFVSEFKAHTSTDHIDCKSNDHNIKECNVLKRILYVLKQYDLNKQQASTSSNESAQVTEIYETISSKDYNISTLMEDWHQIKKIHFKDKTQLEWIRNNIDFRCSDIKTCKHLRRYRRNREHETYPVNSAYESKHLILMDHLNSIHTFIFHSIPESIHNCTVKHIIWIINNYIFNNKIQNKNEKIIAKLSQYKIKIIEFINENKLDGNELIKRGRKKFASSLKQYLKNKKLHSPSATLYSEIFSYFQTDTTSNELTIMNKKDQTTNPQPNSKFVTKLENKTPTKALYYSFGTQYKYTKDLEQHPLYVKPKYESIKEELYEYHKRINETKDANILLYRQLMTIQQMKPSLQPILQHVVQKEYFEYFDETVDNIDLLWTPSDIYIENEIDQNYNEKHQNYNIIGQYYELLIHIITQLCEYITQQDISHNFLPVITSKIIPALLNVDFNKIQQLLSQNAEIDITDELNDAMKTIIEYEFEKQKTTEETDSKHDIEHIQAIEEAWNKIYRTYQSIFYQKQVMGLNPYLIACALSFPEFTKRLQDIWQAFKNTQSADFVQFSFNVLSKISKRQFYNKYIRSKVMNFQPTDYVKQLLDKIGSLWIDSNDRTKRIDGEPSTQIFQEVESILLYLFVQNPKEPYSLRKILSIHFIKFAKDILNEQIKLNRHKYIVYQKTKRSEPYITKSNVIINMSYAKQMKATWYEGMNDHHQIHPNQPIKKEHVLALIIYADCTALCTAFRETYRAFDSEDLKEQVARHSYFAHMGKLVYESFVFYSSRNSEVTVLYHGMSMELCFKTLFCAFDAPTSTTTLFSVANGFSQQTGIIMMLQSSESTKHIKTLDMDVFSCFDHEEEHLIFETRLHIKNIFIHSSRAWVGP
eukprot:310897_1